MTCRCPMCGKKDAGKASNRRSYFRMGISCDEVKVRSQDKRATRKLRRTREKRVSFYAI